RSAPALPARAPPCTGSQRHRMHKCPPNAPRARTKCFSEPASGLISCGKEPTLGNVRARPLPAHSPQQTIIERPQCKPSRIFMKHIRLIFALAFSLAALNPALAADPVYPPGLRIGIVP